MDMSKINNFGKYFIIKNEFETIPEEDEDLEHDSMNEESVLKTENQQNNHIMNYNLL